MTRKAPIKPNFGTSSTATSLQNIAKVTRIGPIEIDLIRPIRLHPFHPSTFILQPF